MSIQDIAASNFTSHIEQNAYPGRGLAIGMMEGSDNWAIVYFIMGRSENSRNRRFKADGDRLWTEPVDESKVTDPSLIIYDCMLALPGIQLVSNGDQTTTILDGLKEGSTFTSALATREREPDGPNFTPRISGMLAFGNEPSICLSILKANKADTDQTDRTTFYPALPAPGTGYALTTYKEDGNPLPSFEGDPLVLPMRGTAQDILSTYWAGLNDDNRVSLAVKEIDSAGNCVQILIENRHK